MDSATPVNGAAQQSRSGSPFSSSRDTSSRGTGTSQTTARKTYGALTSASGRRWLVRGGAATAVGAAGGFLTQDWRIGATFAAAALVALIVHSSRRYSEVPRWRRASAAQRRTEAQLRVMKRLGYRVLHARGIPGGNGQIDHFIVGRRGAFAIDSEAWDKRLPLRNKLEKLYHGKFSKNERIDEALEEARTAERLIAERLGRDIRVRPSLAIYGPTLPWDSHNLRGVDVIAGTKVRKWLRGGNDRLTDKEIEQIADAAENVLPARY
ncbi:nuclease-related domain-containing protein [Streptomonospora wellingtoniae]|uniref:Nuclease-related domain-containing protein n=1 Tax=Streptomonospora wellingtoniae TaxID=3075544 RepID=A0ABU2KPP4_9ACTN|nr:nuclease-related domain-containing protein [Streptomonospora sp. DSM 45055]MDT0301233.1 nuclease-related domain-containing protein [Streptomonospora sp. DSM 45055]